MRHVQCRQAPISIGVRSFGRAIVSRSVLESWVLSLERAHRGHPRWSDVESPISCPGRGRSRCRRCRRGRRSRRRAWGARGLGKRSPKRSKRAAGARVDLEMARVGVLGAEEGDGLLLHGGPAVVDDRRRVDALERHPQPRRGTEPVLEEDAPPGPRTGETHPTLDTAPLGAVRDVEVSC